MTQRTFEAESVRAAIEDYQNNTVTLKMIAAQFGVSEQKFLDWCELDRQFREKEAKKFAQKPMTFKLKDAMPEINYKQNRKHLKHKDRILVYEARLAGGSVKHIAERFGVSTATVINITKELKEYYNNQPVTDPVVDPEPEPEAKPTQVTVMEPVIFNKAIDASDIGVFFEEDFLVLRIPKKSITQELLKGLL